MLAPFFAKKLLATAYILAWEKMPALSERYP
jgi:hypothetical protein